MNCKVRERSLFMAWGWGVGGGGLNWRRGGPTYFGILFWRGDFFNALLCKLFFAKVTLHVL